MNIYYTILANDELKKFFAKCKEGKTRALKISIKDGKFRSKSNKIWVIYF